MADPTPFTESSLWQSLAPLFAAIAGGLLVLAGTIWTQKSQVELLEKRHNLQNQEESRLRHIERGEELYVNTINFFILKQLLAQIYEFYITTDKDYSRFLDETNKFLEKENKDNVVGKNNQRTEMIVYIYFPNAIDEFEKTREYARKLEDFKNKNQRLNTEQKKLIYEEFCKIRDESTIANKVFIAKLTKLIREL